MIDTARHYLSVSEILRMIDSLVMNKFNKLHWHLVDAQSFPYDSPTEPTMINGAFVNHNKQLTYTQNDLGAVKEYAHARGVEVIIEVDVPGHAASWYWGKPEIAAC
jgi:hexosaminidase